MPDPLSESSLLALIEDGGGSLTPEQLAEVRALLNADPALRARIERMVADRAALARLPDALPAPLRTTESAMRRAVDSTAHDERAPSRTPARRTAMLAAAGIGIAILGGVLAFIVNATHPQLRTSRIADAPPDLTGKLKLAEPDSGIVGPEPEAEIGSETTVTNTAGDIAAKLAELEADTAEDPLLDSFLAKIPSQPDAASPPAPAVLSPAEIVSLLREGALGVRITIDPAAGPGARDHADANDAPAPNTQDRSVPRSMPIDIPDGAPDAEVLAALDRAAEPLRARSGFRVEFVRAPQTTVAGADPALATNPRAVLWWSAPPEQWRTVRTRTLPVLVTPEPVTPDAQPQPASG